MKKFTMSAFLIAVSFGVFLPVHGTEHRDG